MPARQNFNPISFPPSAIFQSLPGLLSIIFHSLSVQYLNPYWAPISIPFQSLPGVISILFHSLATQYFNRISFPPSAIFQSHSILARHNFYPISFPHHTIFQLYFIFSPHYISILARYNFIPISILAGQNFNCISILARHNFYPISFSPHARSQSLPGAFSYPFHILAGCGAFQSSFPDMEPLGCLSYLKVSSSVHVNHILLGKIKYIIILKSM
jgi:hypothetical protein